MIFKSLKFRLIISYSVIFGIILIVYSSVLHISLRNVLYNELDREIKQKAREIQKTIISYTSLLGSSPEAFAFSAKRAVCRQGDYPGQDKIKELEGQWLKRLDRLDIEEDYINLLGPGNKPIAYSKNLSPRLARLFSKQAKGLRRKHISKNITYEKRSMRVIAMPFSADGKERYILQVGASFKPISIILHNRLMLLLTTIPIFLICSFFIGYYFAREAMKPVAELTKTANNISHRNLSARVEVKHADEEMRQLANAFNEMISRLEQAFKHIAEFSSHVAHELKTPLAIMRGESEVALLKERSPGEYQRVITVNLEETGRMLKVVEDLLLLAKLDYKPEVFRFERLGLIPFFKEIYEQSKILAGRKEITVDIKMPKEPIYVNADKLHLRRLFFNLIHNAIKFNQENGRIEICLKSEGKQTLISISDTGVGIAEEDLPNIFKRFFHKETAPQEEESGNGLGLSIAQSIARIHNGGIGVKSRVGRGSVFTVTLPAA